MPEIVDALLSGQGLRDLAERPPQRINRADGCFPRVVMGSGASRSTSWISRKHSPGRNQVLRGRCDRGPASSSTTFGSNSRMAASRCTRLARCWTICCSKWLTIPLSSDRFPRKASMTRGSVIAALHPGSRFRMVTGRPHPSEQGRGGGCYMIPDFPADLLVSKRVDVCSRIACGPIGAVSVTFPMSASLRCSFCPPNQN